MTSEALTMHLIREHCSITVSISAAARIVGISKEHAYRLASQERLPVVGTTGVDSDRESLRVLIPRLVEWMYAGGTRQYDERPHDAESSPPAQRGRGTSQDAEMAWVETELKSAA